MGLYIGKTNYDTNYSTTRHDIVIRSFYNGLSHIWPCYNFGFADGVMQKTHDNIPSKGQVWSEEFRTCETSWWYMLDFDVKYTFDQPAQKFLKYS